MARSKIPARGPLTSKVLPAAETDRLGRRADRIWQRYPWRHRNMCGIVGYVGPRKVRPLLMEGLEKLEYRGYDSAGISVLDGDRVDAVRAVGNLAALRSAIAQRDAAAAPADGASVAVAERPVPETGIAHTRWATHGRVTEENAHPHYDTTDSVHIVVNGIVENYIALKVRLVEEGAVVNSWTDAEVIAHLVAHHHAGDLLE